MAIVLSLVAAFFFGTADFAGGYASKKNPIAGVLVLSQLFGLVLVVVFVLLDPQPTTVRPVELLFGTGAGLAGLGGLALLYRGIAHNEISIVSPVAALFGALVPVLFGLLSGERMSTPVLVGLVITLPAVMMISWQDGGTTVTGRSAGEAWIHGITSGILFGLFFVLISIPRSEAGMWPLVAARTGSIIGMTVFALLSRRRIGLYSGFGVVFLAGVLDMAANIFLVLAFRRGLVAVVSMIVSVYPAQTVFLGRFILGQRVNRIRLVGIGAALIGIALISAG